MDATTKTSMPKNPIVHDAEEGAPVRHVSVLAMAMAAWADSHMLAQIHKARAALPSFSEEA